MIKEEIWQEILKLAQESYPEPIYPEQGNFLYNMGGTALHLHLEYLQSHGLIKRGSFNKTAKDFYTFDDVVLTKKGIAYSQQNKTTPLKPQMVEFEDKQLKSTISSRILRSNLHQTQKQDLVEYIDALPSESIKNLTLKLLEQSFDNLPVAIQIIRKHLGNP